MPTHVVFLRAINLGRTRKLPMADLRTYLEAAGLKDVETYINTGNVRFTTSMRSRPKIEKYVEAVLAAGCGFDVPTIVLTPRELRKVYDDAVGPASISLTSKGDPVDVRRYVTLLKADPPAAGTATVDGWDAAGERAKVIGRVVHWVVLGPSQQARLSNAQIEKTLGVGTTRDLKVVTTLAERWGC